MSDPHFKDAAPKNNGHFPSGTNLII